jgi:hypothetical protein
MPEYRIYLLHPDGKIAEAIEFVGQDDLAARHKANALREARAAEIWARTRLVARIAPDAQTGRAAS